MDKSRAEEHAKRAGDRRIVKRPPARQPDPARRLTNYFLDQWEVRVAMEIPRLRNVRPAETIGATTGYFRSTFIAPAAGRVYTEDEVRNYIDQFIEAIRRSMVQIKPNQSAFKRFIGWWGREGKVFRSTAGEARKYFEEMQQKRLTGKGTES